MDNQFLSLSLIPLLGLLDRGRLGTDGAASAESSLLELCRVATDENAVKNQIIFAFSLSSPYLCKLKYTF